METSILPEEILLMICAELGLERQFGTLYQCARSSKTFADPALRTIYQYHELCPAFSFTEDDTDRPELMFGKWTTLWRSIIISSLSPSLTFKPYCRYLRILDFRNLSSMLESTRFRAITRQFFAKPLRSLSHIKKQGRFEIPDEIQIINDIGDLVIPKASLLEEISGHLTSTHLTKWVLYTPKLRRMMLWRGEALDNNVGKAIAANCEHFESLSIYGWDDEDRTDGIFGQFLVDLKSDMIQQFQMIGRNFLARQSFEALGQHQTLRELKLSSLRPQAVENLNGLKACTSIETLHIEDQFGATRLEELHNDVFVEVVQWLRACTKLKDITLNNLFDGPSILAAAASGPDVKWNKLALSGYTVRSQTAANFHVSLSDQKQLEYLYLDGNGEHAGPEDLELMVSSICQLDGLKELNLRNVSDEFDTTHISSLAINLSELEDFWTGGLELSSDILPLLANMRNLKSLTLFALTQFDINSLLDFISRLDPVIQKGFSLSLMAVDSDFALTDVEQALIQERLAEHVGGRFDHVPWREADSDSEEDD